MDKVSAHSSEVGELAPALEQALARICEVEGIALAQVRSIQVDDGEISVRIERPGGSSRVVIYPLAIFAGRSTVREAGAGN
jgi:phosphoribosylpyrophosphate synthetase